MVSVSEPVVHKREGGVEGGGEGRALQSKVVGGLK